MSSTQFKMSKNQIQTPVNLLLPEDMKLSPKKITKADLLRKFEEFKNDNTNLDKVQNQNIEWLVPGVIVELFCPDFSEMSLLMSTDSFYKRFTGIVKILSFSKENARISEAYNSIKAGDIAYIGDDSQNIVINPAWQHWYDSNGRGVMKGTEPIKYIRKFHRWIEHGMLYLVDRDKETVEKEGLEITLATIGEINVPMVFRLPIQDILCKVENPFN
jgi:hypothetical protein